mmetsp:Transcript_32888/g.53411  ORF Transcript_32888/g.53411 Transcript_32888/m.53411 type:complete len:174 (+) Transcript_32888:184-705(+)
MQNQPFNEPPYQCYAIKQQHDSSQESEKGLPKGLDKCSRIQTLSPLELEKCAFCGYCLEVKDWMAGNVVKECQHHPLQLNKWQFLRRTGRKVVYGRRYQCCRALYCVRTSTSSYIKFRYPKGCVRREFHVPERIVAIIQQMIENTIQNMPQEVIGTLLEYISFGCVESSPHVT